MCIYSFQNLLALLTHPTSTKFLPMVSPKTFLLLRFGCALYIIKLLNGLSYFNYRHKVLFCELCKLILRNLCQLTILYKLCINWPSLYHYGIVVVRFLEKCIYYENRCIYRRGGERRERTRDFPRRRRIVGEIPHRGCMHPRSMVAQPATMCGFL